MDWDRAKGGGWGGGGKKSSFRYHVLDSENWRVAEYRITLQEISGCAISVNDYTTLGRPSGKRKGKVHLCTGRTAHRVSRGIALLFHDKRH